MSNIMAVLLNSIAQIEYDRDRVLPKDQQQSLGKMDDKMTAGIILDEKPIAEPDTMQRAKFVAQNLAQAIKEDKESMVAALSSWLATRLPDLKQVKIIESDSGFSIELIFDEEYSNQVAVQFKNLH